MRTILSITFNILFLSFSYLVLGEYSPIASSVDKINNLVPTEKRRPNTVKFLKDSKHWKNLLEKAVSLDPDGILAVAKEVEDIMVPGPKAMCELIVGRVNAPVGGNLQKFLYDSSEIPPMTRRLKDSKTKDKFKIPDFVDRVAKILTYYDGVLKDGTELGEFKTSKPIGDVVESLSLALKKFSPTKWDKEFYEKLIKAADNKPYETDYLIWFIIGGSIIVLLVAGIAIFLVLRRRKSLTFSVSQK